MSTISGASTGDRNDKVANSVYGIRYLYTVYNIPVYSLSTAPLEADEIEAKEDGRCLLYHLTLGL